MSRSPFWPPEFDWKLEIPRGSVFSNLERSAARRPDHPALVFHGTVLTYAELAREVDRLAGYLQRRCNLRFGDRVLLDMQNSPYYVAAYYAIQRADAVVVPVNPMSVADELDYLAEDSGARVAIIGSELVDRFAALPAGRLDHVIAGRYADLVPELSPHPLPASLAGHPIPRNLPPGWASWAEAIAAALAPAPHRAGGEDVSVMPYTSGTTGKPKACVHTHAGSMFTAVAQAKWYGFDDASVLSAFMPLFHVAGMQVSMNAGIYAGATLLLMARWDKTLIPPLFARYGATFWSAAPTMIVDVLASPDFSDGTFATLRTLTGGGATMPAALAHQLESRFGLRFVEGYGLTETIAATHLNPMSRPKPQCLGIPIFETDSRIVDPDTLAELPVREAGEIVISGPQVMREYWRRPEDTAKVFFERDGRRFLRTGDLGYVDEDGYFFIVDRLKRMVNVSGYKVWPSELEAALYHHPAVRECCVVAAPDAYRGETVKALIVLKPEAEGRVTAEEIIAWARGAMAAYKVPHLIEFVDSLPRTGSNKIDWRRLQEAEWAREGAGAEP